MSGLEEAAVPEPQMTAKVIGLPFRRVAAAAAILLLAVAAWFALHDNRSATTPGNHMTVLPQPGQNKTIVPQNNDVAPQDDFVTVQKRSSSQKSAPVAMRQEKKIISHSNNLPEVNPELLADNLPHAGLQRIHPVISKEAPNVAARPIRDSKGNIVLDKELIFTPDNNYIVVTGPNGEQTRISSKFLPMLSSLNGSTEGQDYFTFFLNENSIWKLRFDQWRNKMLSQPSFIPTATNLVDLLELKDILQEN